MLRILSAPVDHSPSGIKVEGIQARSFHTWLMKLFRAVLTQILWNDIVMGPCMRQFNIFYYKPGWSIPVLPNPVSMAGLGYMNEPKRQA